MGTGEEVTIPNAVVVGSRVVNSSRPPDDGGAPLATSVTIGYDAGASLSSEAEENQGHWYPLTLSFETFRPTVQLA